MVNCKTSSVNQQSSIGNSMITVEAGYLGACVKTPQCCHPEQQRRISLRVFSRQCEILPSLPAGPSRESLAGGEILGAADFARMAKERLFSRFGFSPLQLLADNPADWQTGLPALFLEPLGEFRCKTNAYRMTHRAKA
jgi:hypothetical protein